MSKRNKIVSKTSSTDHVYYNIVITNNSPTFPIVATYNSSRTTALLTNPSDYYVSIVRFRVGLQQVPIFVFTDLLYSVTISNGGNDYKTSLIYVPFYSNALSPASPDNRYVYSYQQFIDSINNALSSSFVASGLAGVAPYMTFDPVTQLCSLNASSNFHDPLLSDENQTIKIWFNTELWQFFSNFEKIFNGYQDLLNKNFNIIVKPTGNNNITIPADFGGPTAGYKMTQEFVSLSNWNALRNIVFLTGSIPIRAEGVPAQSPTNNNQISNNNPASAYLPILTDFQISDDGPQRNFVSYVPTSEYRLVDLVGTTPLMTIDLSAYWLDKNNNLYPIYINPLDSLSVKLLFRKKTIKGNISYYE